MAYQYDAMGNIIGEYESEEERLAREKAEREAAQAQVQKQEIITRADGTQTVKTTQEVSAPVAPTAAPVATAFPVAEPRQIVAQPISPEQTFNRMVQVESGGRQFDSQGRILTSPAGAQGIAQIMPATARNPGFGVAPATPEEIATPEGNRAFGERYYQGLLKYFNGDVAKATAAYNGGPGRVERNVQANQGQMNVAQLPLETQGYLQKVLGGVVNAVIPSAQAGTLTEAQRNAPPTISPTPAPAAAPTGNLTPGFSPYSLATSQGAPGLKFATTTGDSALGINAYQTAQDDPMALLSLRKDETQPEWIRQRASARASELLRQEEEKRNAEQRAQELTARVASGDPKASREMAKELQAQEGSYLKMILLGFISPQLAGDEAVKLGFGNKWTSVVDRDGNSGMVEVNAYGKPLKGVKADGSSMNQTELIAYAGGGKKDYDVVGGTFVSDSLKDKDGNALVGSVYRSKTNPNDQFVQTAEGRKPLTTFRPQSSKGSLEDQRSALIMEMNIKLQGKTEEEKMAITREYNSKLVGRGYTPIQPYEVNLTAPQISGGPAKPGATTTGAPTTAIQPPAGGAPTTTTTGAPTTGAPTTTTTGAPAVPGTAPATTGARPTMTDLKAEETRTTEEAQEVGTDIGKLKVNQGKSERQADYLITKMDELVKHKGFETSVGAQGPSYLFGALDKPLPPQLGGGPARDWQNRAREILGGAFIQGIESMKGFGTLTDAEGKAAQGAIQRLGYIDPKTNLPVITATEEEFRAAVKDFQEIIQRNVDGNRAKIGQKPKYGTPPESEGAGQQGGGAEDPASKARAELERRRKKQGQ